MRTAVLTLFALIAFAGNSVLCRMALAGGVIDAASFTVVRLASGAAVLAVLAAARRRTAAPGGGWHSAVALALYALPFSFAYLGLTTGTGALILFGGVQLSMFAIALRAGVRPHRLEWLGLAAAAGGLVYLVLPGLAAPPPLSAALMALAGAAWGVYTLRGRGGGDPLAATAGNFARSFVLVLPVSLLLLPGRWPSLAGVGLAVASGAVASGLGYVVWYAALPGLTATRAALVQLAVPVLAALGGVAFLGEALTGRLALAGVAILGGIALAVGARRAPTILTPKARRRRPV